MKNVAMSTNGSFAAEIVTEGRATVAAMPTWEWRRSLKARLSQLEGELASVRASQATEDERRRVAIEAIHFLCDAKGPLPDAGT